MKKALILVNIGSPENAEKKNVREFLSQFLNDPHVIDMPWLLRNILVNLIIIPFRTSKSSLLYQRLFKENISPLIYYMNELVEKVQANSMLDYTVYGAMRYGKPSLKELLQSLEYMKYDDIVIMPLFPQYASSTSGSIIHLVESITAKWQSKTKIRFIDQFYNHLAYINCFSRIIKKHQPENFDHILFSFHGLPLKHIEQSHPQKKMESCNCDEKMVEHGSHCYKATCYATARLLAEKIALKKTEYTVSFQSRIAKNWLSPFTDEIVAELAAKGNNKILVIAPSFVADCLETTIEIGEEYSQAFTQLGGLSLTLVESLNDSDEWRDAILEIIIEHE